MVHFGSRIFILPLSYNPTTIFLLLPPLFRNCQQAYFLCDTYYIVFASVFWSPSIFCGHLYLVPHGEYLSCVHHTLNFIYSQVDCTLTQVAVVSFPKVTNCLTPSFMLSTVDSTFCCHFSTAKGEVVSFIF